MRILFISNLYPNIRNAQQIAALAKYGVITKVIAPTKHALPNEIRDSVKVTHPRFRNIPILSRPLNGWLYAKSIESSVRNETFDLALASFAYPDGYAVMRLAQRFGFPFSVAVLGSDINLLCQHFYYRRQILAALRASRIVFAKSRALANLLATYGIHSHLDYNGIDRSIFHPQDRQTACEKLKLPTDRRRILYVGNLKPVKGPRILALAFEKLRDIADLDLIFIGAGPEAAHITPDERVRLVGALPHPEIATWMNACDLLCLPSLQEGLPNVILEAMACSLPVVASRVGGVPEIVQPETTGLLTPPGDAPSLACTLRLALTKPWDTAAIGRTAEPFDWDYNARALLAHLQNAVGSS
jgi:glycosyltransferase involved in cell wall biosynthesis